MTSSPNLPVGLSHSCRTLAHCLHKPSLLPLIFDLPLSTYSWFNESWWSIDEFVVCSRVSPLYECLLSSVANWLPLGAESSLFALPLLSSSSRLFAYFTFSQKLAHDLPFPLLIASVFFKAPSSLLFVRFLIDVCHLVFILWWTLSTSLKTTVLNNDCAWTWSRIPFTDVLISVVFIIMGGGK